MKRHSILFKINLIFFIGFIALLLLSAVMMHLNHKFQEHRLFDKMMQVEQVLEPSRWDSEASLLVSIAHSHGLKVIEEPDKAPILMQAISRKPPHGAGGPPPPPVSPIRLDDRDYLHYHKGAIDKLFLVVEQTTSPLALLTYAMPMVLVIFILLYIFIRKSLLPLQMLRREIQRYGEGEQVEALSKAAKDEVSIIYQEFVYSVERVRRMENTRKLFLRNIMHELNTPIAKGKLIAAMSQDSNQAILNNIFERLDLLVRELANVERFTSHGTLAHKKSYRLIDIVDHAKDMLYLEEKMPVEMDCETIECDFEMMAIVFKNLIDNAYKYGENLRITYRKGVLSFSNKAQPLRHPLDYYTEPFTKESGYESSQGGLGLGLYIVSELLAKQGYRLVYRYANGQIVFRIEPEAL
jgi:two-component system OmpR family sensor kinase